MQTGRSTLLGQDDVENVQYMQEIFKLGSQEEAAELAQFLNFSFHLLHCMQNMKNN